MSVYLPATTCRMGLAKVGLGWQLLAHLLMSCLGPWMALILIVFVVSASPPARAANAVPYGKFDSFSVSSDAESPATICGWFCPASGQPRGTLFVCHGFNTNKQIMLGWQFARDELGWNVVFFDFREGGESTHTGRLATLGYYERGDLRAVIDYAEARGAAKPFVVAGRSMGAATALEEAGSDRRISAVLAVSPFRNAWDAASQFLGNKFNAAWAPKLLLHGDFKRMLQAVDIPTAVAKRSDLRIWIESGENDCFPESDERAILAASKSPDSLKRYFLLPGCTHFSTWGWKGNDQIPSYDDIIRLFLNACVPASPITEVASASIAPSGHPTVWIMMAGGGAILGLGVFRKTWKARRLRSQSQN